MKGKTTEIDLAGEASFNMQGMGPVHCLGCPHGRHHLTPIGLYPADGEFG